MKTGVTKSLMLGGLLALLVAAPCLRQDGGQDVPASIRARRVSAPARILS